MTWTSTVLVYCTRNLHERSLCFVLVQALSCLVQIASVRRSLFHNAERATFLNQLVTGVKHILENPQVSSNNVVTAATEKKKRLNLTISQYDTFSFCMFIGLALCKRWLDVHFSCIVLQGLSDTNNYHEFCRLLARLKSNYQLGELVKVDNYPQVIKLIAEFTVTSLQVCVNHMVQPFFVRLLIIAEVSWRLIV